MLDNDIEYIGTKRAASPMIQMTGTSRAVTGFAFNIQGTSLEAAQRLVFHNDSKNRLIVVGRSPPPPPGAIAPRTTASDEDGNAMFRCPVVSRRHASLHFSIGKVFITDSGSHHGTHVLRQGSLNSTKLKPYIATELSDGDVVTFGKTVKNKEVVRPVVVRVELLLQEPLNEPPRQSTSKHLLLANDSSTSNAGRYGVFTSDSSGSSSSEQSADEMDISSNSESDIEEVDPPAPSQPSSSFDGSSASSIVDQAANAIKKLVDSRALPPIGRLQPLGRIPYPFASSELPDPQAPSSDSHSHNQPSQPFVFGSPDNQPAPQSKFTFTVSSTAAPSGSQGQGQRRDQNGWGWSPWTVLPPIRTATAAFVASQRELAQADAPMIEEESDSESAPSPSALERLAIGRAMRPIIRLDRVQKKSGLRSLFSLKGFGVGLAKDGSKSRSKSPLDSMGSSSASTSSGKGDITILSEEEEGEYGMPTDNHHSSFDVFDDEARESEGNEDMYKDVSQQSASTTNSPVNTPERSQPSDPLLASSIPSLSTILQQHEEDHQTETIQCAQRRDFDDLPPIPGYLPVSSPSAAELGFYDDAFPDTRFGGVDLAHTVDPWAYTPPVVQGKGKEREVDMVDVGASEMMSTKQICDFLNGSGSAEGASCTPSTCDKEKAREKGWGHALPHAAEDDNDGDEEDEEGDGGDGNGEDAEGDVGIHVGPPEDSLFALAPGKEPEESSTSPEPAPQSPSIDVEMIIADVNARVDAKFSDIDSRFQQLETSVGSRFDRTITKTRESVTAARNHARDELSAFKEQFDSSRLDISDALSGLRTNGDEVRKVRRDVASLGEHLASAVREIKTVRQALDYVKADVEKKHLAADSERNDMLDVIKSRAEEGKKFVGELEVMFSEVTSSRQEMTETSKKLESEMQSVVELRKRLESLEEEYKAKVASAIPPTVATGPSLINADMTLPPEANTSKRKRAEGDDEPAVSVSPRPLPKEYGSLTILGGTSVDGYTLPVGAPHPAPHISGPVSTPLEREVRLPPKKRSRLMQTTVALAAGAAVTWTALAFS